MPSKKRMLITGASSGIGKALYHYYKSKWEVIGVSRRGPDISIDFKKVDLVFLNAFGKMAIFDVVVLNAGLMSFDEITDHEDIYRVNFRTIWSSLRMMETNGFKILNPESSVIINASVSGVIGDPDVPFYAAQKAALINLVRSYAKILAPVRVNCFSPGFFKSELVPGDPPEALLEPVILGKREADPSELFPVVDMLIDCPYITGQNIVVDGGLSL